MMQKSFLINCIDTYFTGKIKCPNSYVEDLQYAFQLHNLKFVLMKKDGDINNFKMGLIVLQ